MEAYLLSDGLGVPTSYLHVQINEAAIDWWTAGSNYGDVITQAADEAGGHGQDQFEHGEPRLKRDGGRVTVRNKR